MRVQVLVPQKTKKASYNTTRFVSNSCHQSPINRTRKGNPIHKSIIIIALGYQIT